MMTAIGGMNRCESTQNARCLPPVRNRAIEYAAAEPISTDRIVTNEAMITLFFSPSQPRMWFSDVE